MASKLFHQGCSCLQDNQEIEYAKSWVQKEKKIIYIIYKALEPTNSNSQIRFTNNWYQDLAKLKARKVGKTVKVMKRTGSAISERGREIYLKASSQKADLWIERFGFLGGKFLRVKRKITADNYCTAIKWYPNAALMLWPLDKTDYELG